ncbi:MAG: GNAT family N-acetyltransferase [Rikenellaceae bacterium]
MTVPIIEPVARELLLSELTAERLVRKTNKADNDIYIFSAAECPALMNEVGRLREESFREAGGGTGNEVDIDQADLAENGYLQLIVWDSAEQEIVGGYRFIICQGRHPEHLSTEHYFDFSDKFRSDYLPYTIELGRSFVQCKYQPRRNRKGIYALDNLWDGLGALIVFSPQSRYFFGKITMYTTFNVEARNLILSFFRRYFPDDESLISAKKVIPTGVSDQRYAEVFTGESYEENYKILMQSVRELGETIPPLFNAYMSLSPTMKTFDTFLNTDFGEVEETGILITMDDIYPEKYERYTQWEQLRMGKDELKQRWRERVQKLKNNWAIRLEKLRKAKNHTQQ